MHGLWSWYERSPLEKWDESRWIITSQEMIIIIAAQGVCSLVATVTVLVTMIVIETIVSSLTNIDGTPMAGGVDINGNPYGATSW